VSVAETVPAGGVAVTKPVVFGVLLHVAATAVVAAPAISGVAVMAAATATTLSMPATTVVARPFAVRRKSRPCRRSSGRPASRGTASRVVDPPAKPSEPAVDVRMVAPPPD
jgi:hypothetical protein